jgi:hypothetical protein
MEKPGQAWTQRRVRALVREAVKKKWPMFAAFKDLSIDDLEQIGMIRALELAPKYSGKSAYSTWITRGVNFALIDLWRKRSRAAKREDAVADIKAQQAAGVEESEPEEREEDLVTWLARVYRAAQKVHPPATTSRIGRPGYSKAMAVAIAALMRRMKLSSRGAQMLLQQRADLRAALGKSLAEGVVPSHPWFSAARRGVIFQKKPKRNYRKDRV